MTRALGCFLLVAAMIRVGAADLSAASASGTACPATGDRVVTSILVPIRERYQMPAMAAAILTSTGLVHVGAVGVRKRGTDAAVTLSDCWHLGSNGKAMTATLVAKLVEQGR